MRSDTLYVIVMFVAVCVLTVSGCGDAGETTGGDEDPDSEYTETDGDAEKLPDGDTYDGGESGSEQEQDVGDQYQFNEVFMNQTVRWIACDLYEGNNAGGTAECADFLVPQTWNGSHQHRITVRLKRLRGSGEGVRQLWMLYGGPGSSSIGDLGILMDTFSQLDPDLDIYVPEHRGVGYSTRMGCPEQEADTSDGGLYITVDEMPQCIEYLQTNWEHDPTAFTVSEAATDLAFLMEYNRAEDVDQFVYGLNYGGYWAHRYAQMYERQPTGMIMDSVIPPVDLYLDDMDRHANEMTREIFDMCARDGLCSSKLGMDPWQFALDTFEDFKNGHCSALQDAGVTPGRFKEMIYHLGASWDLRVHMPAMLYRLHRCDCDDIRALYFACWTVADSSIITAADRLESPALGFTIAASELLCPDHQCSADLETRDGELLVTSQLGYRTVKAKELGWPSYATDEFFRQWASRDIPMLILGGTLDMWTPYDTTCSMAEHFDGQFEYWVPIPNGAHAVVVNSPVTGEDDPDCGTQIMLDWMKHPLQEPDTSCLADLKQIDFAGDQNMVERVHINSDLYENSPVALSCAIPEDFAERDTSDYMTTTIRGVISDLSKGWTPAVSHSDLIIGEQPRMADSSQAILFISRGSLVADLQGETRRETFVNSQRSFLYTQIQIPLTILNAAKTRGENYIPYIKDGLPQFQVKVYESELKYVGDDAYRKQCPIATDIDTDQWGGLYVCHEENEDFSTGETLEIALRMDLSSDPAVVLEAAGQTDPCICTRNNTQTVECDEYFDQTSEKFVSPPAPAGPYPLPPLMPLTP